MSLNQLGSTWPFVPTLQLVGNTLTINYTGSNSVDLAAVGGDPSQWATYQAITDVDLSGYVLYNAGRMDTGIIRTGQIEPELGGSNIFVEGNLLINGEVSTSQDLYVSSISFLGLYSTVQAGGGGGGGDPAISSAVSTLTQKTNGILSYDAGARLTTFEDSNPPFVANQGLLVNGFVNATIDVVASYGTSNYSLTALGISNNTISQNYNVVMGYYKTSGQPMGNGSNFITWEGEFAWNSPGFAHLSNSTDIVVDISGVYEVSVNMNVSTGTSLATGTNSRVLSFDLERAGSNYLGFVNATFFNQSSQPYNQLVQGIVELQEGDILKTRCVQTLTSGSTIAVSIHGPDYNTWATLKLHKRYP